jgi:hypothetical protein
MINRLGRNDQALGDLSVAQSIGEQGTYFDISRCRAGRVRACFRARAARQVARTAPAQPARDDRYGGIGAERLELIERPAQVVLIVTVSERNGCLVLTSQFAPARRGC